MINFKLSELIYSETAILNNINNMPDVNSLDNLMDLILYCLQPIRELIKKPIIITSGFRSRKLNKILGGVNNSQHCFGMAADFKINGLKPKQIVEIILKSGIEFDQLINEYDKWVHISYKKANNRNKVIYLK